MTAAQHTAEEIYVYTTLPNGIHIGAHKRGSMSVKIGEFAPSRVVTGAGDDSVSEDEAASNARRAVACWNACANVSTEAVEHIAKTVPVFEMLRTVNELSHRIAGQMRALNLSDPNTAVQWLVAHAKEVGFEDSSVGITGNRELADLLVWLAGSIKRQHGPVVNVVGVDTGEEHF